MKAEQLQQISGQEVESKGESSKQLQQSLDIEHEDTLEESQQLKTEQQS